MSSVSASASASVSASLFLSCSWKGVVGAASLVLVTTLDDCVWLVPFVAAAPTPAIATVHGVMFLGTLVGLATLLGVGTWIASVLLLAPAAGTAAGEEEEADTIWLSVAGAVLCWILAGHLIYKKWQKQKRKQLQREREREAQITNNTALTSEHTPLSTTNNKNKTGDTRLSMDEHEDDAGGDQRTRPATPKPFVVMSLTCLGFLDELAYFPSMVLGGIFSAMELCLGTLVAGMIMLGIVTICLAPCQPLIQWLDRHVKLYAVVTIFAIILTIEVIVDLVS